MYFNHTVRRLLTQHDMGEHTVLDICILKHELSLLKTIMYMKSKFYQFFFFDH